MEEKKKGGGEGRRKEKEEEEARKGEEEGEERREKEEREEEEEGELICSLKLNSHKALTNICDFVATKMSQWLPMTAAKPDDLNSIPRTYL